MGLASALEFGEVTRPIIVFAAALMLQAAPAHGRNGSGEPVRSRGGEMK